MKGITEYIIGFDKTHNDTVEKNGASYSFNPNFEQPKHINRVGKVISVPSVGNPEIKVGHEVLVIHTVLLNEVYQNSGKVKSHFCVDHENNYFRFEPNLIVMHRKDSTERWKCHLENVMIQPISIKQETKTWNGYEMPDSAYNEELGYKGHETQTGVIAFGNKKLEEHCVFEGDKILFKKDREYEFEIDGQTYYHMENCDLVLYNSEFKKTEVELEDAFL